MQPSEKVFVIRINPPEAVETKNTINIMLTAILLNRNRILQNLSEMVQKAQIEVNHR